MTAMAAPTKTIKSTVCGVEGPAEDEELVFLPRLLVDAGSVSSSSFVVVAPSEPPVVPTPASSTTVPTPTIVSPAGMDMLMTPTIESPTGMDMLMLKKSQSKPGKSTIEGGTGGRGGGVDMLMLVDISPQKLINSRKALLKTQASTLVSENTK